MNETAKGPGSAMQAWLRKGIVAQRYVLTLWACGVNLAKRWRGRQVKLILLPAKAYDRLC
jgi:hypothetical protein